MTTLGLIFIIIIIIFLIFWQISTFFSIYGGINYVNSGNEVIRTAFKMANLKKNDVLYDLGSGIGNSLLIASKEFGAKSRGIEISPFYYLVSKLFVRKNKDIKIIYGNLKKIDLSEADVIYCYLSPKLMKELLPKLKKELRRGTKLVSKSFQFHEIKPAEIKELKNTKLYLYEF